MKFEIKPFNTFGEYFGVDIVALYKEKWIFCKHKSRKTWENPGGHIEEGETPQNAAKRELYEETGATKFDIEPLCDYHIDGKIGGRYFKGNVQVYFANVHILGDLPPNSEMELIDFFEVLPSELTYPFVRDYFSLAYYKMGENL
ncbi:MAG: NUDIX domain-containing protein [Defluviitaleaceae bacterium]|nr:NUDIX domain-containing protein [Defluviitaleaceae bacterium]